MKYALIEAERGRLPIQRACRVLRVSVSGYYAWRERRQRAQAKEGWLYLALVLDIFSRKIVGWTMDKYMESALVERALRMAFAQRQPTKGELLHHSDRGSQYASFSYQRWLASQAVIVSMSGTGDPYDNALLESCIGALKTECADHRFPSRQVARAEVCLS
jgi:putative transposase